MPAHCLWLVYPQCPVEVGGRRGQWGLMGGKKHGSLAHCLTSSAVLLALYKAVMATPGIFALLVNHILHNHF